MLVKPRKFSLLLTVTLIISTFWISGLKGANILDEYLNGGDYEGVNVQDVEQPDNNFLPVKRNFPPTPETWKYDIRMSNITPSQDNLYLCIGQKIDPRETFYITEFKPLDETHNAHHILLYGCEEPGVDFENIPSAKFADSKDNIWSCGEMAHQESFDGFPSAPTCSSKPVIIYAWAHMAPELKLPPETGFKIGRKTSIKYLVMQIHYLKKSSKIDNSGIQITLTNENLPKRAGVLLLVSGGSIPAKSTESMEIACNIEDDVQLHPFAFRVHTHKYGTIVSGYLVRDGNWLTLGEMSPQKEQMFYPIKTDEIIRKGDILAARCLMNNTSDKPVNIGATDADEMCNFYLMYNYDVTETKRVLYPAGSPLGTGFNDNNINQPEDLISEKQCFSPGPPFWNWKHKTPPAPLSRTMEDEEDRDKNDVYMNGRLPYPPRYSPIVINAARDRPSSFNRMDLNQEDNI